MENCKEAKDKTQRKCIDLEKNNRIYVDSISVFASGGV
jgi:hypothetical protein